MINLDNVYNYYSSQIIAPRGNQRSAFHKKDDLKTIYQNMVRETQHSPLYKFSFSNRTQAYAIGIKEAAMALNADSVALDEQINGQSTEMKAVSGNENVISARLREDNIGSLPEQLSIQVDSLAIGQTNIGNYLPAEECSFIPGTYSFGITVEDNQYTFNLHVHEHDTNQQIQRNLANSINENHIGIHASVRNNEEDGTSALMLRSERAGISKGEDLIFHFDETHLDNDITVRLGVEQVQTAPANASLVINGTAHTSESNHISLNYAIDIDLLDISDEPISISFIPDESKLADKLSRFIDSYNELVDISKNGFGQRGASRLYHDITGIARRHHDELAAVGLSTDEEGYLQRTSDEPIDNSQLKNLFDEKLSDFRADIARTTGKMSLNPLDYVDKVIVTYPNNTKSFPNPYTPSRYSGLLFNDYR